MSVILTEALEDYLEAIYDIISNKGGVRVKDISKKLNVKNSSVTVALRSLREAQFINYEPYGVISLTPSGYNEARRISETHQIIRRFFVKVLGVNQADADETACRLEHAMAPSVMARFLQFVKFVSAGDYSHTRWTEDFMKFCRQNKFSPDNLASPVQYMNDSLSESEVDSQ